MLDEQGAVDLVGFMSNTQGWIKEFKPWQLVQAVVLFLAAQLINVHQPLTLKPAVTRDTANTVQDFESSLTIDSARTVKGTGHMSTRFHTSTHLKSLF